MPNNLVPIPFNSNSNSSSSYPYFPVSSHPIQTAAGQNAFTRMPFNFEPGRARAGTAQNRNMAPPPVVHNLVRASLSGEGRALGQGPSSVSAPSKALKPATLSINGDMSATETVRTVAQIFEKVLRLPPGDYVSAAEYFDVLNPPHQGLPPQLAAFNEIQLQYLRDRASLEEFLEVMDRCPTFRDLVRLAILEERLPGKGQPGQWSVLLQTPLGHSGQCAMYMTPFGANLEKHLITMPFDNTSSVNGRYYLHKDGELRPLNGMYFAVCAFVSALTGVPPGNYGLWYRPDGSVNPECIEQLGLGERGVVHYLAQQILRESGFASRLISPVSVGESELFTPPGNCWPAPRLNDRMLRALDAIGGIPKLQRYAERQDQALEAIRHSTLERRAGLSQRQ